MPWRARGPPVTTRAPVSPGPPPGRGDRSAAPHRRSAARRPRKGAMQGIWYVVGFGVAGVSFVFLTIGLSWLISHRTRGSRGKGLPYESGIDTYGDTHGRFGVSYYPVSYTHLTLPTKRIV